MHKDLKNKAWIFDIFSLIKILTSGHFCDIIPYRLRKMTTGHFLKRKGKEGMT